MDRLVFIIEKSMTDCERWNVLPDRHKSLLQVASDQVCVSEERVSRLPNECKKS
jgi:hypothetical protein